MDLHQYSSHLADAIVADSVAELKRQFINKNKATVDNSSANVQPTSEEPTATDSQDVGCLDLDLPVLSDEQCVKCQMTHCAPSDRNSDDGCQQLEALKCFAHALCCDIINGALQNFEKSVVTRIPKTSLTEVELFLSHNVSTERVELHCTSQVRPTVVVKTCERQENTGGSNSKSKRRKTKFKRKQERDLAKLKQMTKLDKFLSTIEEYTLNGNEDTNVICPVCLDVYYNAYFCKPCDHTFCEPCLRRLAKYCTNAGKRTCCPFCREPIQHCQKNYNLTESVQLTYPHEYRRRRNTDAHNKYMQHPLPSQPIQTIDSAIISNILRRRQQERQRARNPLAGYTPIRINFRRYVSLAALFVLIKALALMVVVAVYNAVLVE